MVKLLNNERTSFLALEDRGVYEARQMRHAACVQQQHARLTRQPQAQRGEVVQARAERQRQLRSEGYLRVS